MVTSVTKVLFFLWSTTMLNGCYPNEVSSYIYYGNSEYELTIDGSSMSLINHSQRHSVILDGATDKVRLDFGPDCRLEGKGSKELGSIRIGSRCQFAVYAGDKFAVSFDSGDWNTEVVNETAEGKCTRTNLNITMHLSGTFEEIGRSSARRGNVKVRFMGDRTEVQCPMRNPCGELNGLKCSADQVSK